jgi:hypothetical protein
MIISDLKNALFILGKDCDNAQISIFQGNNKFEIKEIAVEQKLYVRSDLLSNKVLIQLNLLVDK